jgi:hypothetical protein
MLNMTFLDTVQLLFIQVATAGGVVVVQVVETCRRRYCQQKYVDAATVNLTRAYRPELWIAVQVTLLGSKHYAWPSWLRDHL